VNQKELDELVFKLNGAAMTVLNEIGQMLNFLKISGNTLGLIQNFKYPKLEWRVVHQ